MNINAIFSRKECAIYPSSCEVHKVISLSSPEFEHFRLNLNKDYDFIREHVDLMYRDSNKVWHCILVTGEVHQDGILVESEGSDYARYSAFVPNAGDIMKAPELERRAALLDGILDSLSDHYSEQELYALLHDTLCMTNAEIEAEGFDLREHFIAETGEIVMEQSI